MTVQETKSGRSSSLAQTRSKPVYDVEVKRRKRMKMTTPGSVPEKVTPTNVARNNQTLSQHRKKFGPTGLQEPAFHHSIHNSRYSLPSLPGMLKSSTFIFKQPEKTSSSG